MTRRPRPAAAVLRLPGSVAFSWVGVRRRPRRTPASRRSRGPVARFGARRSDNGYSVRRPQTRHGPPAGARRRSSPQARRTWPCSARWPALAAPGAAWVRPSRNSVERRGGAGRRLAGDGSYTAAGERRGDAVLGGALAVGGGLAARHRQAPCVPVAAGAGRTGAPDRPRARVPVRRDGAAGRRTQSSRWSLLAVLLAWLSWRAVRDPR